MINNWSIGTICVQGTYNPKSGEARVLPIYQSTTYKFEDPDHLADLFDLKADGHIYTRISNPTVAAFEEKVALLEGGVGALATSSGQAATMIALLNICEHGEHILALSTIYGGTVALLVNTFAKFGIGVTLADPSLSVEELKALCKPETKAIFAETIANPAMNVLDFEKLSTLAKEIDVPLVVDNTFPTPYLCQPLKHGAHIVIHSATKYMDGHANSVGGVIVDGGNFNWDNGKYRSLVEPDPSYHGISYVKEFGDKAYITKARAQLLRDIGAALSPFNGFMLNLGLETLHLRMERHSENALKLAEYLQGHDKIEWVNYPKLKGHPDYELTQKYLPKGASGVLTIGINGDRETAKRFISHLELTSIVTHMGDVRTSVLHPATTTHRQLSGAQLKEAGISENLIRISVGIEDIEDIIGDFERALGRI